MPRLLLTLLGPFQATVEGKAITGFESNKVRALLAYLAVEADLPQPREKLAGLLWPDWPEKSARNNLRYALANLRQVIGDRETEAPLLCISRQSVQVNPDSALEVDANQFATLVELPDHAPKNLETAIKLYHGRFLEGFSIPDSTPFEEWALLKREYYDRLMLSALHRLAAAHEARGEFTQALALAWRQVELEPWHEEAQQQLMRLLALSGQRSAALAQYEACRRTLTKELGVEPSHETTSLYEQIRDGGVAGSDRAALITKESLNTIPPLISEQSVPIPEESHAWLPDRVVSARKRLPLILGISLLLIVFLGILGLATGMPSNPVFQGRKSSPAASENVSQPTGSKIVLFCTDAQRHICIENPENRGKLDLLAHDPQFPLIGPFLAWSPDGSQIALSAQPENPLPGEMGLKVFIIQADGSHLQQITTGKTDDFMHDWSLDGEWIAFKRQGVLWAIRPDGSDAYPILQGDYDVLTSSWSPDSQMLAFLNRTPGSETSPNTIWVTQRDGSNPRVLYTFERPVLGCQIGWSPDGRYVACLCHYSREEEANLLLDASGGSAPQSTEVVLPSWFSNYWPRWGNP
jgi:DNA-binding SARP family transcriptional activator